jgi:hypothetical protein
MMSASNTRLRYLGSRAIGFVIQHLAHGDPAVYPMPLDAPEPSKWGWAILIDPDSLVMALYLPGLLR